MFKVFVSHSSIDKELVDALRELITAAFSDEVEIKYSTASVAAGGIAAGQSSLKQSSWGWLCSMKSGCWRCWAVERLSGARHELQPEGINLAF